MPWETSGDYIRSGHRSPSEFEEGSLRTITLSEDEGIKAVIGKPKGQDTTEVQSYLFDKEKWTLEKAKAWFKEHQEERVREHVRAIFPFKVAEKIVGRPLKIEGIAMTAGMSRNFNIYTPEELQNFTSKLISAPVYIEHIAVPNAVGKVVKTEWDGQNLLYTAEIYDEETQQKIRKGLIKHVSVAADYESIDILDGQVPHGLHNAELSLVAVPGIPETNIQIMEKLSAVDKPASPAPPNPINGEKKMGKGVEEAEWDTEYINGLPDSAFAVVAAGGEKDEEGKTVPRTLRKLPYKNAEGNIDLPHLGNALARLNQIEPASLIPAAKKKLCAAARSEKAEDLVSEFCGEKPPAEEALELLTVEMAEELCNQLGGTWDAATNTCDVPLGERRLKLRKIKEQEEPEKDEHGCVIGKEKWDPEQEKCVPIEVSEQLTADEIKQKIADLTSQKAELEKKLYPESPLSDDEKTAISAQLDALVSEIQAYEQALGAAISGEEVTEEAIKRFFEKHGVSLEKLLQTLKSKGLGEAIIDPSGGSQPQHPGFIAIKDLQVILPSMQAERSMHFGAQRFVREVKRLIFEAKKGQTDGSSSS